ncbi:MAG: 2-dehydro-3-deoxygalactonokinase, partial [Saprospiraceae bacterium]|nr:2-dehydro-3-deoxygalactonokinase [Saprospiraceae bacterium]
MTKINDKQFVSIDWGTTHLRIYLVQTNNGQVVFESRSKGGIKEIHLRAQDSHLNREEFFVRHLLEELQPLSHLMDGDEALVISGMASSSIGIRNLPYASLPFPCNGSGIYYQPLEVPKNKFQAFLISGVRAKEDVMRGEETQVIGLADSLQHEDQFLLILPGTHSKHIMIRAGQIFDFKTFMTGEIFDVLLKNSILKDSVRVSEISSLTLSAFTDGVLHSGEHLMLNELFKIRARDLFQFTSPENNYYYLSGLMIGQELRNLISFERPIYLAASGDLLTLYSVAAKKLKINIEIIAEDILNKAVIT